MLAFPAVLGAIVVRSRVLRDVPAAIAALNVYTLHIGFPALVALGVLDVEASATARWGFWLVVPLVDVVLIAVSAALARTVPGRQGGSLALVAVFGNTAYLGLPFVVGVFGERVRGAGSLLVAIQVTIAVTVGPVLLQRWSGEGRLQLGLARLARQPLLWAPLAGLALRALPAGGEGAARDLLAPVAASTSPVAMFLLGMYVATTWSDVRRPDLGVALHVVVRLVVAPAIATGLVLTLHGLGAISGREAAVAIVLAGAPAAIGTFSIAYGEGVAAERVAAAVVWSSLVAAVSLPLLATLADPVTRWP